MSFRDMHWRVMAPQRARTSRGPQLVLRGCTDGAVRLTITRAAREAVGIRQDYELLLNGRAIAVRATTRDNPNRRRVQVGSGQSTITDVGRDILHVRQGERFELDVTVEDGHAWSVLPDALVARMKERG